MYGHPDLLVIGGKIQCVGLCSTGDDVIPPLPPKVKECAEGHQGVELRDRYKTIDVVRARYKMLLLIDKTAPMYDMRVRLTGLTTGMMTSNRKEETLWCHMIEVRRGNESNCGGM